MLSLKISMRDRYKISEERMKLCEACEHFKKKTRQCDQCGCFMDAKTLMAGAECPVGKWGMMVTETPDEDEETKDAEAE